MGKYRVGIIGLGRMGSTIDDEGHSQLPYSVAASCAASPRLETVAGADILPDKREAFGERWGVGALYDDFAEMVEEERPDLVAVCTAACLPKPANRAPDKAFRGDSHAELTVALAEAGVPMLYVEKAMASSMGAADRARDAGTAVLRGRAREGADALPFEPWRQLLDRQNRVTAAECLTEFVDEHGTVAGLMQEPTAEALVCGVLAGL